MQSTIKTETTNYKKQYHREHNVKENVDTNRVITIGTIDSKFEFDHENHGEKFYNFMVSTERTSGTKDVLPAIVSEKLIDVSYDYTGMPVSILGDFRSYNKKISEKKTKLTVWIFVKSISIIPEDECPEDNNEIYLTGFIAKAPLHRVTPRKRDLCDLIIGSSRGYGKVDYIPSIAWGRNAIYASTLDVGTKISITGRIQSREYRKRIGENKYELRTTYEVSIQQLTIVTE